MNSPVKYNFFVLLFVAFCGDFVFNYGEARKTTNKSCGRQKIRGGRQGRILNGEYTYSGEFPWEVAIYVNGGKNFECAGTLIADRWVLGALHCIYYVNAEDIEIRMGVHILNDTNPKYPIEKRTLIRYIRHPKYNGTVNLGYDLVLLQLISPVEFTPYIQPMCLPTIAESKNLIGKYPTLSGWGFPYENDKVSRILQKVQYPIIRNEVCEKMRSLLYAFRILPDHLFICAGYKNGKKAFCNGDSGSPLQLQRKDGSWYLVGIVSFSQTGCGKANNPDIFTRVSTYIPWIRKNIYDGTKQIL